MVEFSFQTSNRVWPCLLIATTILLLIDASVALGQGKIPTAADVNSQKALFAKELAKVEMEGTEKLFPLQLLTQAKSLAQKGEIALKAGRIFQAYQNFRQARWQLPYRDALLPKNVSRVIGSLRLRHSGPIYAAAYSPDGQFLATASADQTVSIWNMGNGYQEKNIVAHGDRVTTLAYTPDGKHLVTGGGDGKVKRWDAATGKEIKTIAELGGVFVTNLVISPDAKYVVCGCSDKALRIYDLGTNELKRTIQDFQQGVSHVALTKKGDRLAVGVGDGEVRLYEFPKAAENQTQPAYWAQNDRQGASYHLAFNSTGSQLARCFTGGLKIYNTPTPNSPIGDPTARFIPLPKNPVGGVSRFESAIFSQDDKGIFTGGTDGLIRLYDLGSGQITGTYKGHNGSISSLAFNPNGTELISASIDHTVRVWPFDVVSTSRELTGHNGAVWMAMLSPDGQLAVTGGADKTVRIWDAYTGKVKKSINAHDSAVTVALFSPDGQQILSAGGDGRVKLWNAVTGELITNFGGHKGTITCAAFNADGSRVVSGDAENRICLWESRTGKEITSMSVDSIPASLSYAPDGKTIASGHVDQSIRLWDESLAKTLKEWIGHAGSVSCVTFSPDGQSLASCGADELVKIWRVNQNNADPIIFSGHSGPLSFVAFRPDGKFLASVGSDQVVKLWKISDGSTKDAMQDYRGHSDWISSVGFSKDGYKIISAAVDKTARIWEVTTRDIPLLAEHTGAVYSVAITPDGKKIVSAGSDETIKIWNLATGEEIQTLQGHQGAVVNVTIAPNGQLLVSSGLDRNLFRWDLTTGQRLVDQGGHRQNMLNLPRTAPLISISPDSKYLLTWIPANERSTNIARFQLDTGAVIMRATDQGREVRAVNVTPDNNRVILGGADGTVRVYDVNNNTMTLRPGGDWFVWDNDVACGDLAITADGKTMVVGSDKGDIKICDVEKRKILHTITKGHDGDIRVCVISPNGKMVATTSRDNLVKLWDIATGKELRQWDFQVPAQESRSFIQHLAFTPDSGNLVTANANTTMYVLELPK